MTTDEVISEIKKCIKKAHAFSKGLGESTSIHRNELLKCLSDISGTEIHIALLEMENRGDIEFGPDPDVILLKRRH